MTTSDVPFHALDQDEIFNRLQTTASGLTDEEARRRLEEYGPNELAEKQKISAFRIFLEQFKSFLIIILLFAVVLSAVLGEVIDAVVIGIIVFFACGLGFVQEYRAERAMEVLKRMAAPLARVKRNGSEKEIPSRDLVPGDIVALHTGDRIPADVRLTGGFNLRTDEAALTGESTSVEKSDRAVNMDTPMAERSNMVYMGTAVVYGRGEGVVVHTGMKTEFGKIAEMLQEVEIGRTPLQENLDRMGKIIAVGALALCFVLAGIGVLRGHELLEMLIWGISLAVAAVPEALPAVVTIGLAIGVQSMVKRHALVRRLPVVETLGCATVICSDKTGTLTQDQMTARRIYVPDDVVEVTGVGYECRGEFLLSGRPYEIKGSRSLERLLLIGSLCNDTSLSRIEDGWEVRGDPTEGALLVVSEKAGMDRDALTHRFPRIGEVPFSSERKRMTTIHRTDDGEIAFMKGAPEVVLETCQYAYHDGEEVDISGEAREHVLDVAEEMAGDALRVLAMGYRRLPHVGRYDESVEEEMVFVGLVGMIDPPREEVKDAIQKCEVAGIRTVMITGDHRTTAKAIAGELGILQRGRVLEGLELERLDEGDFERVVEEVDAYARVSPAHKLKIVRALEKKDHVVAMTGDGVNDAPALKQADIGIAMGITGTDVTKEAADMVLTDDNFASIVAAVEEGRSIFGNIKKYLLYLLSCNVGEVFTMAGAILLGPLIGLPHGAIPLVAIQILFVNLVTDGLPAIALSVDPADPDIMRQKPRPRGQGVFTKTTVELMAITGIWVSVVNLGIFKWALDADRAMVEAQSLCFLTLIMIQLFNAYNFRSDSKSLLAIGVFKNKWLNLSVFSQIVLTLVVVYVPFLQKPFHTFSVSPGDWVIVVLLASSVFPVLEISKAVIRWRERKMLPQSAS